MSTGSKYEDGSSMVLMRESYVVNQVQTLQHSELPFKKTEYKERDKLPSMKLTNTPVNKDLMKMKKKQKEDLIKVKEEKKKEK